MTGDGPHPLALMPDRLVSDGEEEPDDEADVGGNERPEDTGAGGPGPAGESSNSCPLREWPDDDVDDLIDVRGATYQAASTDAGPVIRRRLRKAAEAAPAGGQAAEGHPHGKQPVEPRLAEKHPARTQPGDGRRAVKKTRLATPVAGPKRAIPTSTG